MTILGVSMDSAETLAAYAASQHLTYPVGPASSAILWNFGIYPTGRIPVVYVINRHGVIANREVGYHDKAHYDGMIKALAAA